MARKGIQRSRKQNTDGMAIDVMQNIAVGIFKLGEILRKAKNRRVQKFCFDAASFGGKISSCILLRSAKGEEFQVLCTLAGAFCTLMEITDNYDNDVMAWMIDEYEAYLKALDSFMPPDDVADLHLKYKAIRDDGIELQYALLNAFEVNFNLIDKGDSEIVSKGSYCPRCIANQLKQEIFTKADDLFGTRFQCLHVANGLEQVAKHPKTPDEKRGAFLERAQYIREFGDVNAEDVENYDEVAFDVSKDYACSLVECAVFVKAGLFDVHEMAMVGGFDLVTLKKLLKRKGVEDYLEAVGGP